MSKTRDQSKLFPSAVENIDLLQAAQMKKNLAKTQDEKLKARIVHLDPITGSHISDEKLPNLEVKPAATAPTPSLGSRFLSFFACGNCCGKEEGILDRKFHELNEREVSQSSKSNKPTK